MKKMNNKGFSLVELIVVIAIMAVLMGVLAPTLIGNIEKSRETKDLNALDSVYQAVTHAMSVEAAAKQVPDAGLTNVTLSDLMDSTKYSAIAPELVEELGSTVPDLSATCNKGATIYVTITSDLKVTVMSMKDSAVIECKKTQADDGSGKKKMQVPQSATATTTAAGN